MNKIQEILARLKRLWQISKDYDEQMDALHRRIGRHTTIHADLHLKNPSHIIAIGRYKNHDYVRIFDLDTHSFKGMVDGLRKLEPYSQPGWFDTWMNIPLEAFVSREDIFGEKE